MSMSEAEGSSLRKIELKIGQKLITGKKVFHAGDARDNLRTDKTGKIDLRSFACSNGASLQH